MSWADGRTCQNNPQGTEAKAFLGHHQGNAGPQQPMLLGVGDDAARAGWVLFLQLLAVRRHWENDDSVRWQVTVANDGTFLTRQV